MTATRYDGAVYVCGYAVELALKVSICKHHQWVEFPDDQKHYGFLKTHNLDLLLSLSGREVDIKGQYLAAWSGVAMWDSELRYRRVGQATQAEAQGIIESAATLLGVLL